MVIVRWPEFSGSIEEVIGQYPTINLITHLSLTLRLSIVRFPTVDRLVSLYIGGKFLMISANNQPMSVLTFINNRPMSDRYSSIYMYDGCMTDVTEIGQITLDATWKPQPPHNGRTSCSASNQYKMTQNTSEVHCKTYQRPVWLGYTRTIWPMKTDVEKIAHISDYFPIPATGL